MRKVWIHILLVLGYGVAFMQCYNLISTHRWWPYAGIEQGIIYMSMNIAAIAIAYAANYWVVFGRKQKKTTPIRKLATDILLSSLLLLLTNIPFLYLMAYLVQQSSYIDWIGAFFYNMFSLLAMDVVYFIRQYTYQIKAANATKELALQYQYDALRAQINPHFLFNTLNIIQALTTENPERATQAIQCLSHIYRYVLDHANETRVGIEEEWEFAQSYIELLKFRYEENIRIQVEGTPHAPAEVVPMTMQILLENISKHNTISRKKPMCVRIVFEEDSFFISNTIQRKESSRSTQLGLHYLQNLYANQGIELYISNPDSLFTVKVPYIFGDEGYRIKD